MKSCVTFPVRQTTNPLFYTTNIVLSPILFGLGIMGNLLAVIVFNRSNLRKESPLYVYLTGIAVVDTLTLLLLIPSSIQDMEVLPPNVTYSRLMAHVTTYSYGLTHIFKHTATYALVFAVLVRYVYVRKPFEKPRWTRISASRILAFVLLLFCLMVNFPRFLEIAVTEVEGHCFTGMSLWYWNYTDLGTHHVFVSVYPWVVVALGSGLPFVLLFIFLTLLVSRVKIFRLRNTKLALHTPKDMDENEIQITGMLTVAVITFFVLETLDAIGQVWLAVMGPSLRKTTEFYHYNMIANFLSTLHCCLNFLIYIVFCSDFRKTFRRTFCCFCNSADEYTEPITCASIFCCCCTSCDKASSKDTSEDSGSSSTSGSSFIATLYTRISKDNVKPKEEPLWI